MNHEPATALDRVLATAEEALSSLWRRRPFVVATVGAIAVTLAFPALVVLALRSAAGGVEVLRASERVRAFIAADATPEQAEAVRARLVAADGVASVEVVSPEAARESFLRDFPELAQVVGGLSAEDLAFPASVEAWGPGSPEALSALARRIEKMPAVDEVRYDATAAERLGALASRLRAAAWGAALLALVATAFGIGNVIRMGALSRREQLAVMRLVGAPRLHVRVPFVLEGLVQGALGGLVAGIIVAAVGRLLAVPLQALGPAVLDLPPTGWLLLIVAPALAGALSAAVSVEAVLRRHAQLER